MSTDISGGSISSPKSRWKVAVPEAIVVAGLGVAAYGLAFVYEAAYLGSFGVPLHLVRTSLDSVFVIFLTLSAAIWLLFSAANVLAIWWPENPVLQIKVIRIGIILMFPLWNVLLFGPRRSDLTPFLLGLLFVLLFEFAWPVFVFRKQGPVLARFEADELAESRPRSRTLFGRTAEFLGELGYAAVLGLFLAGLLAYTSGKAEATRKRDFFLVGPGENRVVIRVYPDLLISMPLDDDRKSVRPSLILQRIDPVQPLELVKARVGPLDLERLRRN